MLLLHGLLQLLMAAWLLPAQGRGIWPLVTDRWLVSCSCWAVCLVPKPPFLGLLHVMRASAHTLIPPTRPPRPPFQPTSALTRTSPYLQERARLERLLAQRSPSEQRERTARHHERFVAHLQVRPFPLFHCVCPLTKEVTHGSKCSCNCHRCGATQPWGHHRGLPPTQSSVATASCAVQVCLALLPTPKGAPAPIFAAAGDAAAGGAPDGFAAGGGGEGGAAAREGGGGPRQRAGAVTRTPWRVRRGRGLLHGPAAWRGGHWTAEGVGWVVGGETGTPLPRLAAAMYSALRALCTVQARADGLFSCLWAFHATVLNIGELG